MSRYADAYYTMSSAELWDAFHRGWTGAAHALIDRYDGKPPAPHPDEMPHAVLWARLLAQERNPFSSPAITESDTNSVSSTEGAWK